MEIPASIDLLKHNDVWVCDTAASNHFVRSSAGAVNIRKADTVSQGMTGSGVSANKMMDFVMTQYSKSGAEGVTFRLTDVSHNEKFNFNLFSAARCLKNGWTMEGGKECIKLISPDGSHNIIFDIVVQTAKGAVFATILKRDHEVAGAKVTKDDAVSLKVAHAKLGHCDIEKTRRTAKRLGWKLSDGVMNPCPSCAAGKAKQRNVPKNSDRHKAKKPGERLYHDISTISDKGSQSSEKAMAFAT